ncbi:hypothetical protein TNIN_60131 [Trichonephila inaurata madagascariensis]|uniref:Uncharacterized protein n=1 Tax=Trichonephila inaurata madagascariensis TaxID=2747483 RepID=A0A8X6YK22_9ARAC|nr:hypothetical protein TNIN_60131 [Trichonephila inaurata madagascariensis]
MTLWLGTSTRSIILGTHIPNKKKQDSPFYPNSPFRQHIIFGTHIPYKTYKIPHSTQIHHFDSTRITIHALPEPTHFRRTYRNSPIDIVISKGARNIKSSSIPELSSDHNSVPFEVGLD